MPLIRLARDKRGVDTLYLLQHRPDGRGESRLRVIYFCAAPQGLAFGRQALDPQTRRALDQRYPDIQFDWPALLEDVEQRRLPPVVDGQARRQRPAAKTERRPQPSEVPGEKAGTGKRRRRCGTSASGGEQGQRRSAPDAATSVPQSAVPPIID